MNAPRLARTRSGLALLLTVFGLSLAAVPAWSAAQGFYTVPPCRVYDTRNVGGNAVPIAQGEEREITIVDVCGIPADADAVSFNVTITSPTGPSHLTLYPKKGEVPPTSTINFVAGQTRANNIVLKLYNGGIVARPTMLAPGSVHVILDVNGYFVANAAATANDDDSVNLNNLPVLEDSGATALDVLANDSDPEGDPFFITSASDPANGTVVLTPPGGPYTGLTYQPDPNYCNAPPGTTLDTFTYTITGGDTAMVSVPVTCINDAPAPSGGPFSVAENAANGTSVGTVAHNDPDVGQTHTWLITAGNTGGAFAIDNSGQITVANSAAVDFDTNPTFTLTVQATDVGNPTPNLSGSGMVTINVTNGNEAPAPSGGPFSIPENSANGTSVGTVAANDPDNPGAGQTHTWLITGGNTGGAFAIDNSGQITVANSAAVNFETNPTFTLTVQATDVGNPTPNLSGSGTVTVNLSNVNEAPAPSGGPFSIPENSANGTSVGTVAANDPDNPVAGQTHTWLITGGNTGGAFAIDSSGQITVANSAAVDFETNPTFTLTVQATDVGSPTPNLSGSGTVTINVTNGNDAPAPSGGPFSIPENSANGTSVGTVAANDPDNPGAGQTHTWLITGGNTGGAFAIDSSGQITVANSAAVNFETNPTFMLTVQATDVGNPTPNLSGSGTVTVNLSNVNEAPAPSGGPFSIPENSANGTSVGTVAANDPDNPGAGQTHTWLITGGNTGGAFAIDGSGQITVANSAAVNFETNSTFTLTVQATDVGSPTPNLSGSGMVTINLNNVNEAPAPSGGPFSIPENSANGTSVGTVAPNDPDNPGAGQTHTWLITGGNPGGAFAIDSSGQITVANSAAVNFETNSTFTLTVQATDVGSPTPNLSGSGMVTINLSNVNEAPAPSGGPFSIPENSANGTSVGTVAPNDPDNPGAGQTHTWLITGGNTGGAFAIGSSGQITVANSAAVNFETNPTFTLTVQATDVGSPTPNLSGSGTVTVNLSNVNEAPTDIGLTNNSINENATGTIGTLSTVDPDNPGAGQTHTYSIQSVTPTPPSGSFGISGSNLVASAAFDFEQQASYTVRIRTTDNGTNPPNLTFDKDLTVNILNVDEAPTGPFNESFDTIGNTLLEVAATAAAPEPKVYFSGDLLNGETDPEGQALTVTLNNANGATVNINPSTGEFTYLPVAGATGSTNFTYNVCDPGSHCVVGTATILRQQMVRYVKNDYVGPESGRSSEPFNTLAEAESAGLANDWIFVRFGDGTSTGQNAGILLKAGQHLIGEHHGLTIPITSGSFNGVAAPTNVGLFTGVSGNRPLIDNSGAGNNAVSATDVIPVEIVGLSLQSANANAIDLTNAVALPANATLSIQNNLIRGAGAEGLDINLNVGTTGTLTLNITGNSWNLAGTHTGNAVDINRAAGTLNLNFSGNTNILTTNAASTAVNINGGAFANTTITGFSGNSVHGNSAGAGILISQATFDSNLGTAGFQQVDGDNLVVGASGNPVGTSGLVLSSVQGNLFFDDMDVFAAGTSGTALQVSGAGGGFNFSVTPATPDGSGTSEVFAQTGAAVDISSATVDLRLDKLTSTTSASGLSLTTVGGQFRAPSGSAITKASGAGTAFSVASSSATVTYGGTLNVTSGAGVSLTSNTGSIAFTGTLTLSTGGSTAFNATGGGTVTATDANSTLTTTNGTALNVANTTIGALGLKFKSITAGTAGTGPTNGIVLNNTGSSGGLTVSGTGAAGTGGTIRKAGTGISLTSTSNVVLNWMQLNDFTDFAIRGNNVTNFTLNRSVVNGANGDSAPAREGSVIFDNLFGTATVSHSTISGGVEDNLRVENTSGTLTSFTLSGSGGTGSSCQILNNNTTTGNIGFRFAAFNSANMTASVSNCVFRGNRTDSINIDAGNTSTVTSTITNNYILAGTAGNNQGNLGINVTSGATGSHTTTVSGNFVGTDGVTPASLLNTGINLFSGNGSTLVATVTSNTVRNAGTGSGHGIQVFQDLTSTLRVNVDSNTVSNVALDFGIRVEAAGDPAAVSPAGSLQAGVTNNNVSVLSTALDAIRVRSRRTTTLCADIRSNTTNAGGSGFFGLFTNQANTSTFSVEGLTSGAQTAATTQTYLIGQNPAAATVSATAATNYNGVATNSCNIP